METTNRKGTERSAQVWQQGIDSERPKFNPDEVFWINGLMFELMEITGEKTPLVRGRFIFMIEDIATGEVHIATAWNRGQGVRNVRAGMIGTAFFKRFGNQYLGKIRLWAAAQRDPQFGKYQVETYLLPRLVSKKLRDQRTLIQRRAYEALSPADQAKWRELYPNAIRYVVEGHGFEGDHQRGT